MNDADDPDLRAENPAGQESENPPRMVSAQELFAGEREICIEHEGEVYRLRITRRNKLILQK
ncbi:MAG: hemin uptake protein HemP [Planctomycetes bacterium]|nr:hemin uptake protein HemP [Planctomycetota bacterium]